MVGDVASQTEVGDFEDVVGRHEDVARRQIAMNALQRHTHTQTDTSDTYTHTDTDCQTHTRTHTRRYTRSGFVQNIPTGFPALSRTVCSSVGVVS